MLIQIVTLENGCMEKEEEDGMVIVILIQVCG